jgi:hypothetical protein
MTPFEIAVLAAIAALAYQEIWWRDRTQRLETDYQKRAAAERAMAFASAAEEGPVRALTFYAEKVEPSGLFREVTRPLFITVMMGGDRVRHAAGDLAEIDRFDLPPAIRRALDDFVGRETVTVASRR